MIKLRKKIFNLVFGILTIALLILLLMFNIRSYKEQYSLIERRMNYRKNISADSSASIKFMDANFITVKLGSNDEIIEIINHYSEDIDDTKAKNVVDGILSKSDIEEKHIGCLYFDDYSYSYQKGQSLVVVKNSSVQKKLIGIFKNSILYFLILEIVFVLLSKIISHLISKPVEEVFIKQKNFIADASHELKTPLSVITASAEALEKNPNEKKWLKNIKNETGRMNDLVIELLDLAKTENNNLELSIGNLSKTVELVALSFEGIAFEKGLKLEHHIDDNITFKMDEGAIKQVVEILLDNAINHSKNKGKITISLKESNNIELIVTNLGEEIPIGEEEKIFERFYRVDKSRNRDHNHYGLGLAIAKNIINNHNGTIKAFSSNGKTTFQVTFKK